MTDHPKLYLDSNVFIMAFESGHPSSFRLFTANQQPARPFLFTSLLSMAELLVKPYRENNERLIEMYQGWAESNEILEVGPVDRDALKHAAILRAQYPFLKLPDAVHISTAFGFECSHFVSFDMNLARMKEITHTRWDITKTALLPAFISPDDPAFEALLSDLRQ